MGYVNHLQLCLVELPRAIHQKFGHHPNPMMILQWIEMPQIQHARHQKDWIADVALALQKRAIKHECLGYADCRYFLVKHAILHLSQQYAGCLVLSDAPFLGFSLIQPHQFHLVSIPVAAAVALLLRVAAYH